MSERPNIVETNSEAQIAITDEGDVLPYIPNAQDAEAARNDYIEKALRFEEHKTQLLDVSGKVGAAKRMEGAAEYARLKEGVLPEHISNPDTNEAIMSWYYYEARELGRVACGDCIFKSACDIKGEPLIDALRDSGARRRFNDRLKNYNLPELPCETLLSKEKNKRSK